MCQIFQLRRKCSGRGIPETTHMYCRATAESVLIQALSRYQ